MVADLRALNAAVTGKQLEFAMERALLLAADAMSRFAQSKEQGTVASASHGRVRADTCKACSLTLVACSLRT